MMRLLIALFVGLLLTACNGNGTRPDDNASGDPGQLGSPVKRVSPGDVYVDLGTAYLSEGVLAEAFKNARKALMVDPKLASAHNLIGVVYQRLGQPAQAGEHFRKAVQLEPRNPYALNALGSFVCDQQQFEEAEGYFKRALNNPLYPTPWIAAHNAARCAERAGRMDQAESHYRAALQSNPRFAPSLLRMAHISFDQENYLSARAYLQRYAAEAAHTAASLWLGVRTERQLGDMDQVATYQLKLRAKFPDSEQVRYLNNEANQQ